MTTKALSPASPPRRRPQVSRGPDGELYIERFPAWRRVEHLLAILVMTLLVLTGFPQKFYDAGWSKSVLDLFGGLQSTRVIHRVCGIIFSVMLVVHVAIFIIGALRKRLRLTLVPTPQDLRDAYDNIRFYFGLRPDPPRLPKFDYRQKFEYIGLIFGSLIMVFTGVFLLWPVQTGAVLGGEVLAASRVAHSNEALLALSVLLVWHIYSVIFSPEVFPLDQSAFTGKMSLRALRHHHRQEYDYLFPDGFPELDGDGPSPSARPADDAPTER